jgi:hypothetical protein
MKLPLLPILFLTGSCSYLVSALANRKLNGQKHQPKVFFNRRSVFSTLTASVGAVLLLPPAANAGIDPSLLKNLPVQGDESGSAQRLRQIEAIQRPESDLVDSPFQELPSGVSFREYREGKGEAGMFIPQNVDSDVNSMRLRPILVTKTPLCQLFNLGARLLPK